MANQELLTFLLPMLRADFELGEHYRGTVTHQPDIQVTVVGGAHDLGDSESKLAEWRRLSTAAFEQHTLEGGHFFLNTRRDAFRQLVEAVLRRYAPM